MNHLLLLVLQSFLMLNVVNSDEFQSVLGHIKTKTNESTQALAVLDLIKRLLPDRITEFSVEIDRHFGPEGKDTFYIRKTNDIIKITGTTGVAAAWGFHYYLKYFCNAHISWEFQQLNIPIILPNANITIISNDRFRFYQNVCTTSYSFVWWKWQNWEQHIDWMALNGINLALTFNGQEAIWKRVYRKFNFSEKEIDEHFAGPAFLSWLLRDEYKQLFEDLELILSTSEDFLLGKWLKSAKSIATNPEEARLYEYNARNQISLWGPKGEIKDYANKQWAGVVASLFGRRWAMFLDAMSESLMTGQPFNETRVSGCVFAEVEAPFTTDTNEFPINTTGDSVAVAMDIHKRWRNKLATQISKKKSRGRVQRSSEELEIHDPHQVITV